MDPVCIQGAHVFCIAARVPADAVQLVQLLHPVLHGFGFVFCFLILFAFQQRFQQDIVKQFAHGCSSFFSSSNGFIQPAGSALPGCLMPVYQGDTGICFFLFCFRLSKNGIPNLRHRSGMLVLQPGHPARLSGAIVPAGRRDLLFPFWVPAFQNRNPESPASLWHAYAAARAHCPAKPKRT